MYWNSTKPHESLADLVEGITHRGYSKEAFLPTEFRSSIANGEIKTLSVSDIASSVCQTRRDVYQSKGVGRVRGRSTRKTWGRRAGTFVENHICTIPGSRACSGIDSYRKLIELGTSAHSRFTSTNSAKIKELKGLEGKPLLGKEGDTGWLLRLMNCNANSELGMAVAHSALVDERAVDLVRLRRHVAIHPAPTQIGLSDMAVPDFIAARFGLIGDIKSGTVYEEHFPLTCAGYALAYENGHQSRRRNIDWGAIYFFPTINTNRYVRHITFPQVYFFPIDDDLRNWFQEIRNKTYRIIADKTPPGFPADKTSCHHCKWLMWCQKDGLRIGVS